MKKVITTLLICVLLVCLCNPTTSLVKATKNDWWDLNWEFRKEITISHDMVEDDLENFTILFHDTSTNFSDHAQSDGDDFTFISYDGSIKFNHEIEYYDSEKGELIAWVNITNLNSTTDTTFYIYYGNPTVSNQENIVDTWDSDFVGVWHCNNEVDNGEGDIKDSTIYYNHGTTQNMESGDLVEGKISKALLFGGINEKVLVYDSEHGSLDLTDNMTLECWWNSYDLSDSFNSLMGKRAVIGYQYEYRIRDTILMSNRYSLLTTGGVRDDNKTHMTDTWYYGTVTLDAKNIIFYNEGDISSVHDATEPKSTNAEFGFGAAGEYGNYFEGIIDEVRVSKIPRSAGWVKTSYNTMNNPEDFLSIGIEESRPHDNIPPTVEITYPENGQTVSGIITITGNADDTDGNVEYVEIKIDEETWKKTTGTTSWAYEWDTTELSDGQHKITARSFDGQDYSDEYIINVIVSNGIDNIPPNVEILTPHYGCIYFTIANTSYVYVPSIPFITLIIGKIYVIANASDNVGVKEVEFWVEGELRHTDYEVPYIWKWNDQTMLLIYELKVVARDFAGNEGTDIIRVWRLQVLPPDTS
ncbi:MAG: hypothetical protein AYK22_02670 [Thermoplasmatales archaeon SG8-52-3]|nr:MAG: hypothetical protein AYK22_02670 [Thermoplasmatales archaeon SG8-52-3]